jgi:LacI family transcriptional regulator
MPQALNRARASPTRRADRRGGPHRWHLPGRRSHERLFAGGEWLYGIQDVLTAANTTLAGVIECDWRPDSGYDAVSQALA